jgi:hypothetical protein
MTATTHVPLVVTAATTRAQVQAEIAYWRGEQRAAVIPSTADEKAAEYDVLLEVLMDQLLAREPEPA